MLICSYNTIKIRQMQEIAIDSNKQPRVNSICCYVCGREFGTRGFSFHYKECLLKYANEEKKKAQKDRSKLPEAPEELKLILAGDLSQVDLIKFNESALYLFKYKVLPACKYCKRTFNAESLAVHIKGCSKKPSGYQEKENEIEANLKIPKALVCCVCGQRFGTASLKIHYPECTKKFKNEENRKHRKQSDRRIPPEFSSEDLTALQKLEWTAAEMESFNVRATELYRNHGMAECDNCGRKFFFEQLQKHRKNCELINGKLYHRKSLPEPKQTKVVVKPKMIVCFICGRQYGTKSIVIHTSQCSEMFQKLQQKKLKEEKKKIPTLSPEIAALYDLSKAEEWRREQIEQYNKLAFECYNNKSLSKCYICQRTFFEQSLPKHIKNCESRIKDVKKLQKFKKEIKSNTSFFGDNFLDNVIQLNKQLSTPQFKEARKPKMLVCLMCGRQYGVCSLKIHLPKCRGETQEKKIELKGLLQNIKSRYDISDAQNWADSQIGEYNKQVFNLYKKNSLFECHYCHRTFFEESLKKHIKHCQKQIQRKSLKRSQTLKIISHPEEDSAELDQSIPFEKNQSEKIIFEEQNEDIEETYHALEYGTLMNQNNEDQQQAEAEQENSKINIQEPQSLKQEENMEVEVMSVEDF